MVVRRAASACAIMVLSAFSVGACALLVGSPGGQLLFDADAPSNPDGDADASLIEGSPSDAQPDGDASEETMADVGSDTPQADTWVADAWGDSDAGRYCQIGTDDLITNGDFSMSTQDWAIVYGTGTIAASAGELCVSATGGQPAYLGWTPGTRLPAGTYDFWYCAQTSQQSLTVIAVVGHSTPPNTTDFTAPDETLTSTLQVVPSPNMPYSFTLTTEDTSAGLSFQFTSPVSQDVCFEAVSLTPVGDD